MAVRLNTLDLNLLRVLDAVMEERSVGRAGERLALTASAVSHALARLRELLEDDLLVRTPAGMQPTARALLMAPHVREALVRFEQALGPAAFAPETACRRFVLAANDFLTAVLGPALLRAVGTAAPGVDLVIRPGTRIDLAEQIDAGRIDCAVGSFATVPDRLKASRLFAYRDVLITASGGPFRDRAPDLTSLAAVPLAVVSLGGAEAGAVAGFISERGLARRSEMYDRAALERAYAAGPAPRLHLVLPHFLALPALLADATMAAIVPSPLAAAFARSGAIAVHPLPYPTEPVDVLLVSHERNDADPAIGWLRRLVATTAAALDTGAPAPVSD